MTKIMLVEDDKSLREIYGVRLLAEGYDIVSAGDGEEALAMAIKERPQLIISDVMMPKVSGYDMLDILRSTTETRAIKVIMMTALSSEEQRKRGESLGADRYLVKSQVGIEDVVNVVHEVLGDRPTANPTPSPTPPANPTPPTAPVPPPVSTTVNVTPSPTAAPTPLTPLPPAPRPSEPPRPASLKSRVIQPLNDPTVPTVDMNELLDKELAKEAGITEDARPPIATTDQEKEFVDQQIANFAELPVDTKSDEAALQAVIDQNKLKVEQAEQTNQTSSTQSASNTPLDTMPTPNITNTVQPPALTTPVQPTTGTPPAPAIPQPTPSTPSQPTQPQQPPINPGQ